LKGLHLALNAFAKLVAERPRSRFTIVGGGADERPLRALAIALDIDGCVDWVPWLSHSEVLAVYPQHDVFLFPSLHDSSGNVVLEAMSRGLPVVCLKRGGPAAIVDAFSGLRVAADESAAAIDELAGALRLLADNPPLRLHLARGAHTRANNFFSWEAQIDRMDALYRSLGTQAVHRGLP
jgi:glycosyltransferase involved in cell wall biosynthesis